MKLRLVGGTEGSDREEYERLLAEQAAGSRRLGGREGAPEVDEYLEEVAEARVGGLERPPDVLESRYESLRELLRELYSRLESGSRSPEDFEPLDDPMTRSFGVIDHPSEEYLAIGLRAVKHTVVETAAWLGVDRSLLIDLLATPEGRGWLFTGEDPSEWVTAPAKKAPAIWENEREAVAEEVEELEGLWDTPEVVDEDLLPEETAFGARPERSEPERSEPPPNLLDD